jgi:hypothetical protein
MPLIQMTPKELLRQNKLACLEELADLDVASVLPPTDKNPEAREPLLLQLQSVEAKFDALGATDEDRDVSWEAEGLWRADDGDEE